MIDWGATSHRYGVTGARGFSILTSLWMTFLVEEAAELLLSRFEKLRNAKSCISYMRKEARHDEDGTDGRPRACRDCRTVLRGGLPATTP
jgi:hypothetical protein